MNVDKSTLNFIYNASAGQDVTVTTNQGTWSASSNQTWCTVTPTTGTNGQTFTVTCTNNSGALRTATITVTAGSATPVTVTVTQLPDPGTIPGGGTDPTGRGFVGAFWRASERGERIIRMYDITGSDNTGDWTVSVVWYDSRWNPAGGDGIVFDHANLTDLTNRGIYSASPGDPESSLVTGTSAITGTVPSGGGDIIFRIGLQKKFSDTGLFKDDHPTNPGQDADLVTTWPARYAVVLLSYNNNTKFKKIFIRQGEGSDYLMYDEAITSGDFSHTAGTKRPDAVKFKPYNLTTTEPNFMTDIGYRGGVFTTYPTQAGALFNWATPNNIRFAYPPAYINILGLWPNSGSSGLWTDATNLSATYETCPIGYHRASDGATNVVVPILSAPNSNVANSQMRQSLWLNPQSGDYVNNLDNSVCGYYADGWFDRRAIVGGVGLNGGSNSSVSVTENDMAHIGRLFFNPVTNRSIFFPLAGIRYATGGDIRLSGAWGYYFSSSSVGTTSSSLVWLSVLDSTTAVQSRSGVYRYMGGSLRCVRDE